MKTIYSTFILACFAVSGLAQSTYLQTLSVDNWGQASSSIDTLLIEVKPKGLYAEVTMTMDFSVRGNEWNFWEGEDLEIEMLFLLPFEAEVTDMWLWVFGIPEQAGIYDLWTATHIYDSIVDRRIDPAILYHYVWQNHATGQVMDNLYRFQIFPLRHDMPRKAKITYQVPLKAGENGGFQVPLPMAMAELSDLPIERFTLRYFRGVEFGDAGIVELPGETLINAGSYEEIDLTDYEESTLNLSLQTQRPEQYLGRYTPIGSDTSYVQISFTPSDVFTPTTFGKKTVVLFDHVTNEVGHITANTMSQQFANTLLPAFTDADSLNILFSGIVNQWMFEDWMVTDAATKDWITEQLSTNSVGGYSSITMLLVDAVLFLTENGGGGTIVLVSNSNQMANASSTNSFLQNMGSLLNGLNINVHVVDCDNVNTSLESFYYQNQYTNGNSAAFKGLAAMTGGSYRSVQNMSLFNMFTEVSTVLEPSVIINDLNVSRTDGTLGQSFILGAQQPVQTDYERFEIASSVNGSGDFIISFSILEANGNVHQYVDTIAENMAYELDTVADNIWAGLMQRTLYNEPQSEDMIHSIIEHSKHYRVLSKYTAFLALEPAEGPPPGPGEPPVQTSLTEENGDLDLETVMVFPNPFKDMLTLDMTLLRDKELVIVLYDIHGREVMRIFNGKIASGKSLHTFDLTGVQSGMYVLRVSDHNGMPLKSIRAVKL